MAALVTISDLRTFAGITGEDDARLTMFVDQASADVRRYLGRDISQHTYPNAPTDGVGDAGYYDGRGTRLLILRQRPVSGTVRVWMDDSGRFGENPDGSFASDTELVLGTDFAPRWDGCLPGTSTRCSYSGIVERIGGVWHSRRAHHPGNLTTTVMAGAGNIKVTYTAGFATIPTDLQQATLMLASWIRRNADKGAALASESLGGYSYSIASGTSSEFGDIRRILSRWRGDAV